MLPIVDKPLIQYAVDEALFGSGPRLTIRNGLLHRDREGDSIDDRAEFGDEAVAQLEMGKQHLDFFAPATGLHVFWRCGVRTGYVAGVSMQIPRGSYRQERSGGTGL